MPTILKEYQNNNMIFFGTDILLRQEPSWKKQRIGFVTNHAATTNKLASSRKALLGAGFNIVKLFSPEHGLNVQGADGIKMNDGIDVLTQLPFVSLYNEKLAPTEDDLRDIDIVLFDIPDIGCRFYTYLWTMTYMLEACSKQNKKIVLDVKEGDIVMFPSYTIHRAPVIKNDIRKTIVSFNFVLDLIDQKTLNDINQL
jgi:uncharacterized protein YbbC (DUF1343 family)